MQRVIVLGGKSAVMALAMQELGRLGMIRRPPNVIVIDDCAHLRTIDMMATQVEDSEHAGERYRQVVKRVNSGRSRAGKAARWA